MKLHVLDFAKIIILQDDIAEVVVNDKVELTEQMVREYHQFLLDHLTAPFSLLINKINSYTYSFQAQLNIANLEQIHAMGVVAYNRVSKMSTEVLARTTPSEQPWNMRIFSTRQTALDWLVEQQAQLSEKPAEQQRPAS